MDFLGKLKDSIFEDDAKPEQPAPSFQPLAPAKPSMPVVAAQPIRVDAGDLASLRQLVNYIIALDPKNTHRVCRLIRKVADLSEKNVIVVVTHDIRAAIAVADMVWVMGRERDANGQPISGGRILHELELAQQGLAWHEDIYAMPEFIQLETELSAMFQTL
jgi:hypothetical protein